MKKHVSSMRLHWLTKSLSIAIVWLLTSDSIILSKQEVKRHFEASSTYIYAAAEQQNASAQFQAYQISQYLPYLTSAAQQGHVQAAWQLYKVLEAKGTAAPSEDTGDEFWLEYLVAKDHPQALIEYGLKQIRIGQLPELPLWLTQKSDTLANAVLSPHYQSMFDGLWALTELFELTYKTDNYSEEVEQLAVSLLQRASTIALPKNHFESKTEPQRCTQLVQALVGSERHAQNLASILDFMSTFNKGGRYCFSKPIIDPRLLAICPEDEFGRAQCHSNLLSRIKERYRPTDDKAKSTHWIIVTKQGNANTRDNLIFIDEQDTAQVLLHELAHWSGLIDEYQLRPEQQAFVCRGTKPYWPGKNVLVAPKAVAQAELESQLGKPLYPVQTCAGSQYNSYRVQAQSTIMEYFDLPISGAYQELIFAAEE
ncbi:hypothetical protein J1N51_04930 [Psychrosphaera ytuae]|uniref:Sel1 repeat family protein n=1 Tax=Psychrosphaera ytuae TaxID=2820710 RepID=A0A975DCX9_9GAMM|nr:hypothetical protein [Psychrosphaera ytuae]QTH64806.1 hypothetical protein J1N51_04930 [Psychrosphaera ytuae]